MCKRDKNFDYDAFLSVHGIDLKKFSSKKISNLLDVVSVRFKNASIKNIGTSLCMRPISIVNIGNINKSILLAGAFHGMEYITSMLLIVFIFDLLTQYESKDADKHDFVCKNLKRRGVAIIPCVNPDGVEIALNGYKTAGTFQHLVKRVSNSDTSHWQANARGVDINHNFDASWYELRQLECNMGILGPAKTRYGGSSPESEPETKSIVNLCKSRFFSSVFAFHSQGEEIYWNYNGMEPKNSKKIAHILSLKSGYKISSPVGIASKGGFKDWFIKYFRKPGFTIEVGKGVNPLLIDDLKTIYLQLREMLFSLLIL